jgi:hypothetical protein
MPAKEPTPFRRCQRPPGVTDWYLRTPAFRRLFHDVYVDRAQTLTPLLMAQAALLVAPGATVSHHSAARLWGGVVPDDGFVHLACPNRRPQVDGIKAHRASASGRTTTWRGLVVTTPVQTFLDLAPHLGLVDLVVLGDSLVKQKRLTPEHLVEAATAHRGAGPDSLAGRLGSSGTRSTPPWSPGCACSWSWPACRNRRQPQDPLG